MEDINKVKWEEAMRDEYLSLIYNETWTLEFFKESGLIS